MVSEKKNKQLPRTSTLKKLIISDSVTLNVTNQNTRKMGQTICLESFDSNLGPVKALSCIVNQIFSNVGSTKSYLCNFLNKNDGFASSVMPDYLISVICFAITTEQCWNKFRLGCHSFPASWRCHVIINARGSDAIIMKRGQRPGLTFLVCSLTIKSDIFQKIFLEKHTNALSISQHHCYRKINHAKPVMASLPSIALFKPIQVPSTYCNGLILSKLKK